MFVLVIISWPWWLAETSLHKIIMDQKWGCRTVGPKSKIPPKIKKKSWNWRIILLSSTIWQVLNMKYKHRKRKLCQSAETFWSKFVKSQEVNYFCGWFYPIWTNVLRPPVTKALPATQPALTRPASRPSPRTFAAFKGWRAGLLVELCQRHSATTWRRLLRPNFEAVFEAVSTEAAVPLLLRLALGLGLILLEASGTCAGASP